MARYSISVTDNGRVALALFNDEEREVCTYVVVPDIAREMAQDLILSAYRAEVKTGQVVPPKEEAK